MLKKSIDEITESLGPFFHFFYLYSKKMCANKITKIIFQLNL